MILHLQGPVEDPIPRLSSETIEGIPAGVFTPRDDLRFTALPVTFDEVAERLQVLDGCFFEPDGAFFVRHPAHGPGWRIEGELYDNGAQLQYVTLRITRDRAAPPWRAPDDSTPLTRLLPSFGWPESQLTMQWARHGVTAPLPEFLGWLDHWTASTRKDRHAST